MNRKARHTQRLCSCYISCCFLLRCLIITLFLLVNLASGITLVEEGKAQAIIVMGKNASYPEESPGETEEEKARIKIEFAQQSVSRRWPDQCAVGGNRSQYTQITGGLLACAGRICVDLRIKLPLDVEF